MLRFKVDMIHQPRQTYVSLVAAVSLPKVNDEEATSRGPNAASARAAESSFPAHAELRKVVDDLSALRMKQVSRDIFVSCKRGSTHDGFRAACCC